MLSFKKADVPGVSGMRVAFTGAALVEDSEDRSNGGGTNLHPTLSIPNQCDPLLTTKRD